MSGLKNYVKKKDINIVIRFKFLNEFQIEHNCNSCHKPIFYNMNWAAATCPFCKEVTEFGSMAKSPWFRLQYHLGKIEK